MMGKITDIPNILYKYRSWGDNYHKDMIIKDEIFFASPKHFNDPFDCKVPMRSDLESDEYIRSRYEEFIREENPNFTEDELNDEIDYWMKKRIWEDPKHLEEQRINTQNKINITGIFSLAKQNNNILMWSHYADSHKGYCVGFITEKLNSYFKNELFNKTGFLIDIIKVDYPKEYPLFLPSNHTDEEFFINPISVKAIDWIYEQEYRCYFHKNADIPFKLPPNIIESVYLGCEVPLDDRQEIWRILATKPYLIKLFQASLEKDKFGIQFKEVKF